jgi:hypothetical protein
MFGIVFNTSVPVHISSMGMDDYIKYNEMPVVLCRVVQLKPEQGTRALVAEIHPMAEEFAEDWDKRYSAARSRAAAQAQQQHPDIAASVRGSVQQSSPSQPSSGHHDGGASGSGDNTVILSHLGPAGNYITANRYKELTKDGCSFCSGDLAEDPESAKKVSWVDNSPVCITCANDPENATPPSPPKGILH